MCAFLTPCLVLNFAFSHIVTELSRFWSHAFDSCR